MTTAAAPAEPLGAETPQLEIFTETKTVARPTGPA